MNWIFYTEVIFFFFNYVPESMSSSFAHILLSLKATVGIIAHQSCCSNQRSNNTEEAGIPGLQYSRYSHPREKALLSCMLSFTYHFTIFQSQLCLPHCRVEHWIPESRSTTATHQMNLPGLYLSLIILTWLPAILTVLLGNGSSIFPAGIDYAGSFQYLFIFFKEEISVMCKVV